MLEKIMSYVGKVTDYHFTMVAEGDITTDAEALVVFKLWEAEVPVIIQQGEAVYDSSYGDISHVIWDAEFLVDLAKIISVIDSMLRSGGK